MRTRGESADRVNRRVAGAALAAAFSAAAMAGCASASAPAKPAHSDTGSATSPTSTSPVDYGVDPVPLPAGRRAPAVLPELAHIPYALGRTVHFAGYDFTVPQPSGNDNPGLVAAGSSLLVDLDADNDTFVDLLSPDGKAVRLSGATDVTVASPDGTRFAAWYRPKNSRSREIAIYTTTDGKRTALWDRSWGDSYDITAFDGSVVTVRHDGLGSTSGYRWDSRTGTTTAATFPKLAAPGWVKVLGDDEYSPVPSPSGKLTVITTDGSQLVGVMRSSDWQFVVSPARAPRLQHLTWAMWADEDTVLFAQEFSVGSRDRSRIVTYHVSTGRVAYSKPVTGDLTMPR